MELSPDGAADPFPRRAPPKFLLPRLTATANDNEPDALLVWAVKHVLRHSAGATLTQRWARTGPLVP